MYISKNWLKQYVGLPDSLTPEELALQLTMSTVEVEGVENQKQSFENIVVGKVKKTKKHPDADKLLLCTVSDGEKDYSLVCGGSNVREGILVAFAKVGSKVRWHGEGDLVELKKAKIRGEVSEGMICASTEIGLGGMFPLEDEKEILDLTDLKLKPGTQLAEALELDDVVLDIDNKSMTHRPDLWGHYGMAREVAAIHRKKLKKYKPDEIKPGKEMEIKVEVEDKELCPRYMAVALDGVKIGPSPGWLQKRLMAVGIRPINNIVDITNYIMFDLGQPMHAFDSEQITMSSERVSLFVRRAKKGEKFTTLDEKEHELTPDMLVIADDKKPVALAGIMGGENSEVNEKTKAIIFESANFNAINVRRTSTALGLRTDSSARFEKAQDPNNCKLALKKAVELTLELCPEARVVSNVADVADYHLNTGPIELDLEFVKRKIGMEIEKKKIIDILERLGFGVKDKKHVLKVTVPTWRATKDVSIPEDLVEEISRIYGYDNIDTELPSFPVIPPERNKLRELERKIKELLVYKFSFTESYNYSFVSPDWLKKLDFNAQKNIELENPLAKDRPLLRRSLLPNLIENLEKNLHFKDNVSMFEVGKIFDVENPGERAAKNGDELLPRQSVMLGLVFSGKNQKTPFYGVSDALVGTLETLGFHIKLTKKSIGIDLYMHPGRQAEIFVDETSVGEIFELHPTVQKKAGIDYPTAVAEIDLSKLLEFYLEKEDYTKVPEYPSMDRDIAMIVDKSVQHVDLVEAIEGVSDLIVSVELFDVYEGKNIEAGKKSLAYHIVYQSGEKTLKAEEVDKIQAQVEKVLESGFGVEVRK
ncbi:MAG: phenylalanine--tRNA ligase subunit beta [Candidatus Magasanikbacteria bacterium]|nr:phenylalanine--tRNA ligase subunit beta [Candidatus Magasanikbacteria bacterium]